MNGSIDLEGVHGNDKRVGFGVSQAARSPRLREVRWPHVFIACTLSRNLKLSLCLNFSILFRFMSDRGEAP